MDLTEESLEDALRGLDMGRDGDDLPLAIYPNAIQYWLGEDGCIRWRLVELTGNEEVSK